MNPVSHRVGIVTINYRSPTDTVSFAYHTRFWAGRDVPMVIVNNSAGFNDNKTLASGCNAVVGGTGSVSSPRVVLDAGGNIGCARANNLGARFLARHFDVDFILFANTDVQVEDGRVLEHLVAPMLARPDIGMTGPDLTGPDGRPQNPVNYVSLWRKYVARSLCGPLLAMPAAAGWFSGQAPHAKAGPCHRLSASFLLVRASAFAKAGGFDEHTFLFGEEQILTARMAEAGFQAWYEPSAPVFHETAVITRAHLSSAAIQRMEFENELYFHEHYRQAGHAELAAARSAFEAYLRVEYPLLCRLSRVDCDTTFSLAISPEARAA